MRILVVDDNPCITDLLQIHLSDCGWQVQTADCGKRALDLASVEPFDVVILDLNLPDIDGGSMVRKLKFIRPESKTIVISGSMGVAETVDLMKLQVYHCFSKPLKLEVLRELISRIETTDCAAPAAESQSELVAVSAPMLEMYRGLRTIARAKGSTVLITGETGTGKEVVARRLHRLSDRRDKPFVAINCSAIAASLIESELFGHEKGAFTDARATHKGYFEVALDGTVFLDEIGDLSLELQTKLLRVLQERSFRRVGGSTEMPLNARVISATNVDLAEAVKAGKFREDLYYRLAVIPIHLLPLRQRKEDILPLAERFIRHLSKELGCDMPVLTPEQKKRLCEHAWCGNVRELRNVIERFVVMGGQLEFVSAARHQTPQPSTSAVLQAISPLSAIDKEERKMIYSMLLKELLQSGITERPTDISNAGVSRT